MNDIPSRFCTSCGEKLIQTAVICTKCGSATSNFPIKSAGKNSSKSKVAALLLAVFLGYWSFLYTFRYDAFKFWLSSVLVFATGLFSIPIIPFSLAVRDCMNCGFVSLSEWLWLQVTSGFISSDGRIPDWAIWLTNAGVTNYPWYAVLIFVWVWAIFSQAFRRESYFRDYYANKKHD